MPVAAITEFDGMSKSDYEAGRGQWDNETVKKAGLLGFVAGNSASGVVIIQLWQSQQALESFAASVPSGTVPPSRTTVIEVADQEIFATA
jgi:hypothetical protein